ncbi:MAG: hypothetical protein NVV62_12715 [Terricaulis sp.]|nr:hypothetical protein [Terricaulis sp.]
MNRQLQWPGSSMGNSVGALKPLIEAPLVRPADRHLALLYTEACQMVRAAETLSAQVIHIQVLILAGVLSANAMGWLAGPTIGAILIGSGLALGALLFRIRQNQRNYWNSARRLETCVPGRRRLTNPDAVYLPHTANNDALNGFELNWAYAITPIILIAFGMFFLVNEPKSREFSREQPSQVYLTFTASAPAPSVDVEVHAPVSIELKVEETGRRVRRWSVPAQH